MSVDDWVTAAEETAAQDADAELDSQDATDEVAPPEPVLDDENSDEQDENSDEQDENSDEQEEQRND